MGAPGVAPSARLSLRFFADTVADELAILIERDGFLAGCQSVALEDVNRPAQVREACTGPASVHASLSAYADRVQNFCRRLSFAHTLHRPRLSSPSAEHGRPERDTQHLRAEPQEKPPEDVEEAGADRPSGRRGR